MKGDSLQIKSAIEIDGCDDVPGQHVNDDKSKHESMFYLLQCWSDPVHSTFTGFNRCCSRSCGSHPVTILVMSLLLAHLLSIFFR